MFWFLACSVGPPGLDLPLTLEGDGVVAEVTRDAGCNDGGVRIGLWGERFGTRGQTRADVVSEDDGSTWLHFRVDTGLGEAIAALRIQGNGAVLPLGARPGEAELLLKRVDALSVDLVSFAGQTAERIKAEQALWQDGAFIIQSDEAVVGELQFRGDEPPVIGVADAWWFTPRPVEASFATDGADLVITFDVEPSFEGEGAQIRVNVPTRAAVAPLGPVPVAEERRFTVKPGRLSADERADMQRRATMEADALERRYVDDMAKRLSAAALQPSGECAQWDELNEDWGVMFPGYTVDVQQRGSTCAVELEPTRVQHGRRYQGTISR
ncbi:MAG: hypothetical protein VX944_16260 [Myxococcota bacterium]|nr:hypothetical protein [Myxococcota bacterium]MEC9391626.1 hypothetical protein [Myxococcota bacterium]